MPTTEEQRRLLELYKRAESAADALVLESSRALEQADRIMNDASSDLVEHLLSARESAGATEES